MSWSIVTQGPMNPSLILTASQEAKNRINKTFFQGTFRNFCKTQDDYLKTSNSNHNIFAFPLTFFPHFAVKRHVITISTFPKHASKCSKRLKIIKSKIKRRSFSPHPISPHPPSNRAFNEPSRDEGQQRKQEVSLPLLLMLLLSSRSYTSVVTKIN